MPIVINEDGTVTVTGAEAQTIVDGLAQEVSNVPVTQALSTELEQIVSTEGPDSTQTTVDGIEILVQTVSDSIIKNMYIVDHGDLLGLGDDDHTQYLNNARGDVRYTPYSHITSGVNPHGLSAPQLPGISAWGLRVTQADLAFIDANMTADAIPSTKIENLVAGKIAAGTMAARVSMADTFTASLNGSVLNDDQVLIGAGNPRIEMGFIADVNATYMLRHHNGYADNHPSYESNFSLDSLGNLSLAGDITITGGLGIANLSDAGALATRDSAIYFGTTADRLLFSAIEGDLWYDTDDGNTPYRFNGATWDSVKDGDIAVAQGAIDGKVKTYFQPTEPTGLTSADNGDIWFDDDDGNHIYIYNHSGVPKWEDGQDSGIATAIGDAATAQSTADGKVTTYVSATAPTVIEGIGDLWYDTANKILYRANVFPVDLVYDPLEWDTVSNAFDDTNLLADTANLGGTADWSTVNDDGARPEDNADVTDVGARNLVLRGLILPNQTVGSVTQGIAGLGNWSFTLPDSTSATQQMVFDLPPLLVSTDYVLTFKATCGIVGSDMVVELFPAGLPDYTVTTTATGETKYELAFNSADAAMATAVLRFTKLTVSTNPTDPITIYDVKFEEGRQPTDWSPFDTTDDLQIGTTITDGGITINGGGSVKSTGKDNFADTTAGFFLGWDATETDYVFNIGSASQYLKWDGATLEILGDLTLGSGNSVSSGKTSFADTTAGFFLGDDSGTPKVNVGDASAFFKWDGTALTVQGTLNASSINGSLNVGTLGNVRGGQTAYNTGTGFFLGYSGAAYKFSIGDGDNIGITFDGTDFTIGRDVNVKGTASIKGNNIFFHDGFDDFNDYVTSYGTSTSTIGKDQNFRGFYVRGVFGTDGYAYRRRNQTFTEADWGTKRIFRFAGTWNSTADMPTVSTSFIGLSGSQAPSISGIGVDFIRSGTTIHAYPRCRDADSGPYYGGGASSMYTWTAGSDDDFTLEIKIDGTTSVEYWIDGVLQYTHSTTADILASGGLYKDYQIYIYMKGPTAAGSSGVWCNEMMFLQEE